MVDKPKAPKSGRWQFSLRELLVAVAFLCVSLAAMVAPSPAWSGLYFTAVLLVFLTGILGVVYYRGSRRAFWLGVLIFEGSYMLLWRGPWFVDHLGRSLPAWQFRSVFPSPYSAAVANYFSALLLAYLGGLLARYFYSTRVDGS